MTGLAIADRRQPKYKEQELNKKFFEKSRGNRLIMFFRENRYNGIRYSLLGIRQPKTEYQLAPVYPDNSGSTDFENFINVNENHGICQRTLIFKALLRQNIN